ELPTRAPFSRTITRCRVAPPDPLVIPSEATNRGLISHLPQVGICGLKPVPPVTCSFNSGFRICTRKYAAQTHSTATVSQPTSEAPSPNVFVPPSTGDGTMSLELFTAACSSMVSNRLPSVFAYSHATATDIAVTC